MGRPPSNNIDLERQAPLFEFGDPLVQRSVVKLRPLRNPIWTENKARLIERYLYYFVLITKHGTYIDGFAGPQYADRPDTWAARLVLGTEPKWLRRFILCEKGTGEYAALETLRDEQPSRKRGEPKRAIDLYHEDFNVAVKEILATGKIRQKEASFCLVDQRTFECKWATLQRLAEHKSKDHNKVELFYFLAASWLPRALAAQKDQSIVADWWGRDDWQSVRAMKDHERAELVCQRFRDELGYRSALAWPIRSREHGGRVHYHMIHASDHLEAPKLMHRAYHKAVTPKESPEQLGLPLKLPDS
jgi:three-Cys-motif partner protein